MENMDDFLARWRLQEEKCKFRDATDTEERLTEQVITGTKHPEQKKQLLAKAEWLTLQEALNICWVHKASISYMIEMAEIHNGKCQEIDILKMLEMWQHAFPPKRKVSGVGHFMFSM